ncbi:multidrug effflux MFS transporter [Chitinophaga sp. GCM10012297]|uniref:Multidrug effflux MFS transporter n=1 Tax=Chitinophaga chungangae TaxID=2821488 RepID=A0ABS3Y983_9BACT|nr:multidrug effflux MFS transporter [Chitinophaga chungangae]MBO9151243.1 multidrug effflux MFS transporter [Chitinophaga chungangae]
MKRSTYFFLILILGSLTALGPFTIDMYLPGFGAIAQDLHTDVSSVGLTLSSYFFGIFAGQLLFGPLLDKFGRKRPLYIGLLVYILTSAGCVITQNIDHFIALRFFQAIGSCAATVTAMAMVRDLFPVSENAKVFALLMLVVGASPMIAPTVGGYVTSSIGWHAIFIILTIMGILMLLASIFWLPGSFKPDRALSLAPGPIIRGFWQVAKEARFYTYAITGAIAFSALFAYVSASPKVFMDVYHVDEKVYGWIFAALSVGFIGSSQVNTLLLRRFSSVQILPVALGVQSSVGLLFAVAAAGGWLSLWSTLALLFILLCSLGFVNPNTAALSLAPFERNAGTASSLLGALQMGAGGLASVFVSLDKTNSALPLALVMAVTGSVALAVLLICRRNIRPEAPLGTA